MKSQMKYNYLRTNKLDMLRPDDKKTLINGTLTVISK